MVLGQKTITEAWFALPSRVLVNLFSSRDWQSKLSILIYLPVFPQPDPLFPEEYEAQGFDRQNATFAGRRCADHPLYRKQLEFDDADLVRRRGAVLITLPKKSSKLTFRSILRSDSVSLHIQENPLQQGAGRTDIN